MRRICREHIWVAGCFWGAAPLNPSHRLWRSAGAMAGMGFLPGGVSVTRSCTKSPAFAQ